MIIKMKSTRYGSADGVRIDEYKQGETYDVRDSLASIFLQEGWAVKVDSTPRRTKDAGGASENKSATAGSKQRGEGHGA